MFMNRVLLHNNGITVAMDFYRIQKKCFNILNHAFLKKRTTGDLKNDGL